MQQSLAALLLLAPVSTGQARIFDVTSGSGEFGGSVVSIGDVTGDGIDEVAVGQPGGPGKVFVYSGWDGDLLYSVSGSGSSSFLGFGYSLAALGDVNSDGTNDFVVCFPAAVTAQGRGSVHALSGLDGTELYRHESGDSTAILRELASAGDVNNDGITDWIVGAPQYAPTGMSNVGRARVHSGLDGSVLLAWYGTATSDFLGYDVAGVGDLDGDDHDDVIAGAKGPGAGAVFVYSGRTGALIRVEPGPQTLGFAVSGAGDLDLDGVPDYLATALGGPARAYSGADGSVLFDIPGVSQGQWGATIRGGEEIDGDGIPDILIGDWLQRTIGTVWVHSGADGSLLHRLDGDPSGYRFGDSVDFAHLADGANSGVVVGAPGGSSAFSRAYAFQPGCTATNYCGTTPNSVGPGAVISITGSLSLQHQDSRLVATGVPPDQFAAFFYGAQTASVPFGDGTRCVGGGELFRLEVFSTGALGTPTYLLDFSTPPAVNGTIQPDVLWYFQCWYRDPGSPSGFNLSDALRVHFCP